MAKGKFPFELFSKKGKDSKDSKDKDGAKKAPPFGKTQKYAKGGGVELRGKTNCKMR